MATALRVLVIDADEADAGLVIDRLRRGGYAPAWRRVDSAATLAAALAEPWDLVLCDWQMPAFSGAAALALLRERAVDVPIVIVAGVGDEQDAVTAMRAGAHDYVMKNALTRLVPAVQRELREAERRRAHQRAKAELRVSEERFVKAFEYAPIAMAMVSVEGRIVKVNRAMCDMFGYTEPEMMRDVRVWDITHPDDMAATIDQLQRLLENEIDTWFLEKRYFHRDGRVLWGRSTTWLLRDADGQPVCVVSQVQDITEPKRLAEQMRHQQSELAHVLRVATMGETLAQIAHEVNQPLASIVNYAHGLIARLDGGRVDVDTTRAVVQEIADGAMRASEVIRRLREFMRRGDVKLVHCDVNDIVRDTIRLCEPDLRQHAVRLDLELAAQPLPVEVDPIQVAQVLLNLIRNAIEAMLGLPLPQRRLQIATARCGARQVEVRVRDSGVGLPADAAGAIFEPFYTTKPAGLGLGLSISRSIVQAHGGALWATSSDIAGTTVGFSLPVG